MEEKKNSIKIKKTIATLLVTVGLAVAAFCGVSLLSLALNTDALNVDAEDWLQDKEYGESDTLAWHMMSDMDDVIVYMGLQQALEDQGVLNLDRPALVVQYEDGTVVTYSMADLVSLGEDYGIFVYDELQDSTEDWVYYNVVTPTDEQSTPYVRVLWSITNREDATVDLGTDAWTLRQERIDAIVAAAQRDGVPETDASQRIPAESELDRMSLQELVKLCGDLPTLYPGVASFSYETLSDWQATCTYLEKAEREILSQQPFVEEAEDATVAWEEEMNAETAEDMGETYPTTENAPVDENEAVADITAPATESTEMPEVIWTPELHEIRNQQHELRYEIYENLARRREGQNTSWVRLYDRVEIFLRLYLETYYRSRRTLEQPGNLTYEIVLTQNGRTEVYQDPYTVQNGQALHAKADWDMSYSYDSATRRIETDMPASTRETPILVLQRWMYRNYDSAAIAFGIDTQNLGNFEDAYNQEAFSYAIYRNRVFWMIGIAAVCALAVLVGMIWLVPLCGRGDGDDIIHLNLYDRIPTELGAAGTVLLGLGICLVFLLGNEVWYWMMRETLAVDVQFWMLGAMAVAVLVLIYLMLWLGLYGLIRRIKAHTLWKNSLCFYVLRWCLKPLRWCRDGLKWCGQKIKNAWHALMDGGDVTWKTAAVFIAYLLINFFLLVTYMDYYDGIYFLLILAFNVLVGAYLILKTAERKRIRQGVTEIAAGKLDHHLPLHNLSGEEKKLAEQINRIGGGLKAAVEDSLKNERMKTELITNVSHDIKTPLTSIINYVDLLKREHIQDPKIQGYIQVLDQKSQRLKTLTEDLVEASKASSGTLKLSREKIDFVELIHQTTGEFNDRFAACNLNLVTNIPETPSYIMADGRYVWRILENLYRNAEKYSMPGTRVYIEVFEKIGRVFFVMKNVSNAPLNIKAEELTERFIRGDVSRTTEGSGLGLSIAKDMTELMNGTFRVYLDGDLFRVTVSFAVIPEQKTDLKEMEENIRRRVAEEEKKVQVETADVVTEMSEKQEKREKERIQISLPKVKLPKLTRSKKAEKEEAEEDREN